MPAGVIDSLLTKDMIFAAFCVALLYVIYKMVQLGDQKSKDHAIQIKQIYTENEAQQVAKDIAHTQSIERMNQQFIAALDKITAMAQGERRESNDTLRALTESFNRVIEKRGEIRPWNQGMGEK